MAKSNQPQQKTPNLQEFYATLFKKSFRGDEYLPYSDLIFHFSHSFMGYAATNRYQDLDKEDREKVSEAFMDMIGGLRKAAEQQKAS